MACWWRSPDCIGLLLVCVPSPCLVYTFCWGVLHHPVRCGSSWYPRGTFIAGGTWLILANLISLFWSACLLYHWYSRLLGLILFAGRSQWPSEPLGTSSLVGMKVLPNSHPSYLWLAPVSSPIVTLCQRRRGCESSAMTIQHTYYLVLLVLSISLVITIHYKNIKKVK